MARKIQIIWVFSLILFSYNLLYAQWWKSYPYHQEGSLIYFPRDEGSHPEFETGSGTEWWYVNMHLQGQTTKRNYSAMAAYFSYNFRIFNVTDETNNDFLSFTDFGLLNVSEENLDLKFTLLTGGTEHWITKADSLGQLLPFQYRLQVGNDDNNIYLDLDAQKPPLIIGSDGLITIGTEDSYYYSQTQLAVTGSLTFMGNTEPVNGIAWIDHQYGPFYVAPGSEESYEWFSLQLDNGMDINLWNIFTGDNKIPNDDSHRICSIYIDDQKQDTTSTFSLERLAFWKYTNGYYFSSGWRFFDPIHKIDLTITPLFQDQVVPFFLLPFWEGSCHINGIVDGDSVDGHAFAELLHIYKPPVITVISPNGGELWDGSQPVTWRLEHPDDGNPLHYDLFYKAGNDTQYFPIITGIIDTTFIWDVSELAPMDSLKIKVFGYSIDSTITGTDISDGMFSIAQPTTVEKCDNLDLNSYKLCQNYPNPFNTITAISYQLAAFSQVELSVYDMIGTRIKTLVNENQDKGNYQIQFDATDLASGMYFYKLKAGNFYETKKMILIK